MFSSSLFFLSFLFYISPLRLCHLSVVNANAQPRICTLLNINKNEIIALNSETEPNPISLTADTNCPRAHKGVLLCPQTLSQSRRTRLRRAFTEATTETVNYARTVFKAHNTYQQPNLYIDTIFS